MLTISIIFLAIGVILYAGYEALNGLGAFNPVEVQDVLDREEHDRPLESDKKHRDNSLAQIRMPILRKSISGN